MFTNDWAKTTKNGTPGVSVYQHCLTVSCVTEELLRKFTIFSEDNCIGEQAVKFLATAHDVGKISLDFLQKSKLWLRNEGLEKRAKNEYWKNRFTRWHSEISQQSLQIFLENTGHDRTTAYFWAAVVGAHHGLLLATGAVKPTSLVLANKDKLEEKRQNFLLKIWEELKKPKLPCINDGDDPHLWSVAGLITLSDWIGSDEKFFPSDNNLSLQELLKTASEVVDSIGIAIPNVEEERRFQDIFNGRTPYPMQIECAKAISEPGIYILEAPMGMGKTEAALWTAYNLLKNKTAQGVYFALPTQITSNRMFFRLQDFAKNICPYAAPTQLIHGNSWLCTDLPTISIPRTIDDPKGESQPPDGLWFTSRRALFAPFGVGTVDQVLLAVLAVKHFPLRRFALSRKVVILDEVHSYDVYTGTLIRHLCNELEKLKCTVIILSATLTKTVRSKLLNLPSYEKENCSAYPCLTGRVKGSSIPVRTPPPPKDKRILITHSSYGDGRKKALKLASQGAQILWVCDTVDSAQNTYLALREESKDTNITFGLLHSRFPFYRREQLEKTWMNRFGTEGNRDGGAILVSTQIVEQSVDLDADALFSELAPTDMLLQRLGRLWRHSRKNRPVSEPFFCLLDEKVSLDELRLMDVQTIRNVLGNKGYVYHPYALLRTLEQWSVLDHVCLPSDIRHLIDATYAPNDSPEAWEELAGEKWGTEMAAKTLANMETNIWQQALPDDEKKATRLSDHTDYVFVLCTDDFQKKITVLEDGSVVPLEKGSFSLTHARVIHRNTVKLAEWHFTQKPVDNRLEEYHVNGCIIFKDGNTAIPNLKSDRYIFWDETLGIVIHKGAR